ATPSPAAHLGRTSPATPPAELVLRNGRQKGMRRPIHGPVLAIGQAAGCEVRLQVDGVEPWHALIATTPGTYLLRDLDTPGGTLVNDTRITTHPLAHGDVVTIGPFQFTFELAAEPSQPPANPEPANLEDERAALRVQVAAVAAQQAALTAEELRLDQRRVALQRQEDQLAGHLEERQRKLQELQRQVKEERDAHQAERAETQKRQDQSQQEVEQARVELAQGRKQLTEAQQQVTAHRE